MSKLDTALTTFVLLIYIGAFTPSKSLQGVGGSVDPAGKIGVALTILSAPLVLFLIYRNRERFLQTLKRTTWPLYMVTLALLSTLWSINSGVTLRRAVIFAVTATFGVHLASLVPELRDRLFGRAVVFTIVVSILIVIFLPEYGISGGNHFGEWRGVWDHKNIMGKQMVFSFFLALYSQAFRKRTTAYMVAFMSLFLLVMSKSGTAIAAFAVVLAFAALLSIRSFFARRESVAIFWLIVVPVFLVLVAVGFGLRDEIFDLLGKDQGLSGRTTLWQVVLQGIDKKPWLGWGYESFFSQAELHDSLVTLGPANHAHNGFLDIILATGYIGLAVFVVGYLIAFWNAWRMYKGTSERSAQWPLLFLALFVLLNVTESVLLRTGTFLWIPYVALAMWGAQGPYQAAEPSLQESELPLTTHAVSV